MRVSRRQEKRLVGRPRVLCGTCRGLGDNEPTEAAFRYVARRFGVDVPAGGNARDTLRDAVTASAIPDELAEILRGLS